MKLRQFRFILMLAAVVALTMPIASQAGGGTRYYGGTGLVYNETDGLYYPVATSRSRTVYRIVDDRYIPVATYGKSRMVNVACQHRGGWWWNTTWMAPSMDCYYVR